MYLLSKEAVLAPQSSWTLWVQQQKQLAQVKTMTISCSISKTRWKTTTEPCQLLTSSTSIQETFVCSQSARHPGVGTADSFYCVTESQALGTKGIHFREMSIKPHRAHLEEQLTQGTTVFWDRRTWERVGTIPHLPKASVYPRPHLSSRSTCAMKKACKSLAWL